jgi:hypothetical protein
VSQKYICFEIRKMAKCELGSKTSRLSKYLPIRASYGFLNADLLGSILRESISTITHWENGHAVPYEAPKHKVKCGVPVFLNPAIGPRGRSPECTKYFTTRQSCRRMAGRKKQRERNNVLKRSGWVLTTYLDVHASPTRLSLHSFIFPDPLHLPSTHLFHHLPSISSPHLRKHRPLPNRKRNPPPNQTQPSQRRNRPQYLKPLRI